MKKFLLGLLGVSVIAFSASPVLNSDPADNTNVFQTGEKGKIAIKGKLVSDIPNVKYIVYAAINYNDFNPITGEVLELPLYKIPSVPGLQPASEYGFVSTPSKVYIVRGAVYDGMKYLLSPLEESDVSYFKLDIDPIFAQATAPFVGKFDSMGGTYVPIMSLYTYSSMETLLNKIKEAGVNNIELAMNSKDEYCFIDKNSNASWLGGKVSIMKDSNSQFTIESPSKIRAFDEGFNPKALEIINDYFSKEQAGNPNLALLIRIQ